MNKPMGRPRVVFDCNVCLQAMAFENSPSSEALRLMEAGEIEVCVSRATLDELRRVLGYSRVVAISPHMTAERFEAFFERLLYRATFFRRVRRVFRFQRDPQDACYLDLCLAARADFLVSRDQDLLSLMSGHTVFCKEFRQRTQPLKIVDPLFFLRQLASLKNP